MQHTMLINLVTMPLLRMRVRNNFRWLVRRSSRDKLVTVLACSFIALTVKLNGYIGLYNGPCPSLVWENNTSNGSVINCRAILEGVRTEIQRANAYPGCKMNDFLTDSQYIKETSDCDTFKHKHFYEPVPNSQEEIEFPIAYSILMYENVFQMETLLRLIYRPQNIYCIHIDKNAHEDVHNTVKSLSRCFHNMFITTRLKHVEYGTLSIVEAEFNCLRDLVSYNHWKYFINLTGKDMPIRTNYELVQILKAYNGGNDVQGFHKGRPKSWTAVRWKHHWLPLPISKGPAPHNFTLTKGSTHVAVSRAFVEYILHNSEVLDLLAWMNDIRVPDEHFFNTLSHSPHLKIPGAFIGLPDGKPFLTRHKLWRQDHATCKGRWVHGICNFGPGDLLDVTRSPAMFANKFKPEWDPIAYKCFAMWHQQQTYSGINKSFDVQFYRNQVWVTNHV